MGIQEKNYLTGGHLDESATAMYVDALLQEDQETLPEPILEHVDQCEDCKNKVLELFLFLKEPDVPENEFVEPKVVPLVPRPKFLFPARVAAVFVVLALSLAAYFLVLDKNTTHTTLPGLLKQNDATGVMELPVKTPQQDNNSITTSGTGENGLTGENHTSRPVGNFNRFQVNPNLESMVDSQSRSHMVRVVSPLNNADIQGDILFSMENFPTETCGLKILNNRSKVLYSVILKENRFVLKEKLGPGLYYWKLENDSDLLHVGKFFIR